MGSRPSSLKSRRKSTRGYTLTELLVALFVSGIMMAAMTGFVSTTANVRQRMSLHAEAQHGLRALLALITQELRQAGACLPESGQFIALGGSDGGDQDRLTLRVGRTDPDTLICLIVATTDAAAAAETTVEVADSSGFMSGNWVYVTPNGATGNFYRVVGTTATSITFDTGLDVAHPAGSGIYGVDERVYSIDNSTYSNPVLTVSMDGGTEQPLVDGVELFNVQYLLEPCPPCNPINIPANDTEWRRVRSVSISATVRSENTNTDGDYAYETGQVSVKPRNLL